jgi:MFS transporter, DHA1 family, tetracycline resistance protein
MEAKSSFSVIMPLFVVIFIDTLSGTLLGPILPTLFVDSPNSILSHGVSPLVRYFLFGFTSSIFFIATFFACPILGDLSDRLGRKKIMMVSLFGAFIGYLLSVVAVLIHAISLLLVGRMIAGITAGSISAAKAAVIDVSTDKNRTTFIGYILLALSLGTIIGPLVSGILSNSEWGSWFHITTPLYAAALISLLNVIYLYVGFHESYTPTHKPLDILSGLTTFVSAFMMPNIRGLATSFLFMQLGWSIFVQFIPLFLALRYQFSPYKIGIFMSCMGVGFTLAFCYLLSMLTARFELRKIALYSIGLILIFIFIIVAVNHELTTWVLSIPAATCLAIAYSVLVSLFSGSVDKDQQGWVMGLTGAISAFSFGLSGLVAGLLVDINVSAPIWLSLILLIISIISVYFTADLVNSEKLDKV